MVEDDSNGRVKNVTSLAVSFILLVLTLENDIAFITSKQEML